jgi:hypothetical protein
MSSHPRPHEEFLRFLRDGDLQERYERETRNLIRRTKSRFRGEKEEFVRNITNELAIDDEHRRVLNACVYPFAKGEIPGYYFVRAAPLVELEPRVKNMDFLIVCANPSPDEISIAIVGESKGNINDPEPIVSEMKERIAVLESQWGYVKQSYLNDTDMPREFVLGVLAIDANETAKSVIRKGGGMIVWGVDFSNDPVLDLHRPDLDRSDRQVRETMYHRNKRLSRVLDKLPTSESYKSFYLQSHVVAKLRVLTAVDKGKEDSTFTFDDVKTMVKEALDYVSEDRVITEETTKILTLAQSIGFVKQLGGGKLKIKSKNKKAEARASEIEKRWFNLRVKQEIGERIDGAIADLQPSYERERRARPALEEVAPTD